MRKRKPPKNPTSADLPTNPEFKRFAAFTTAIIQVPKHEIDALLAEEREIKAKLIEDVEIIEDRLAGHPACEPE